MTLKVTMAVCAFALVGSAMAASYGVTTPGALGADDFINFDQWSLGNTWLGSSLVGTTANGVGFKLFSTSIYGSSDDGNPFYLGTDGVAGVRGIFNAGTRFLYHSASFLSGSDVAVVFDTPVAGVGLNFQSNLSGNFTGASAAWDAEYPTGNFLAGSSNSGNNTLAVDGSAPFMGVVDDAGRIKAFYFGVTMDNGSDTLGDLFGNVIVRDASPVVPEPASLTALGIGALALIRRRRSKKA